MSFFPMGKWWSAILIMIIAYIGYGSTSNLIFNTMPEISVNTGNNLNVNAVIATVGNNYLWALELLMFGMLFYILIAGIPGQQEETIL